MSTRVKPAASSLSSPQILGKTALQLDEAKWVQLERIDWKDQDGKERKWEVASRKTRGKSGVDAVAIAAVLKHPSKPPSVPIILQYRPPIEAVCVELPAGLVDESEDCATAAKRELYEETGYGGSAFEGRIKVELESGTIASDPGMSTANMRLVTLSVELKEGEEEPKPNLDEGEHIEVRVTPLNELYSHLEEYEKLGYVVDARLHHFAAGIEASRRFLSSSSSSSS